MGKLLAAVVAMTLVATPALAQKGMRGGKEHGGPQQQKSEDQKKAALKLEKDYKAALDSIPNKKYDPWGSMRPAPKTH